MKENGRLNIEDLSKGKNYHLKLSGVIDLNNSHELRAHYEIFRESKYSNLHIDFTEAYPKQNSEKSSLDTSVAATMIEFYRIINRRNGSLNITMTESQSKIIDLCRLRELFEDGLTIVDKQTH
ncbi:hypothetical protein COU53_01850 [Candidatus Pacearchaeota archaeon CG10_big_fil_rev_8_21_14_0_10_30_48]|nr:MAG: hypothetical protein COU53_01850 [Candidatus Pacearchaeota archaeon CG10_big_fil_rev_8_21_14_0_10_30_48]